MPGASNLYEDDGSLKVTTRGAGVGSANTSPTSANANQQLTGLSTAKALPNIPQDATSALVSVSGQPVRWRNDGTNPTSSIGMPAAVGEKVRFYGAEIAAVKLIETAASATLDVYYSK